MSSKLAGRLKTASTPIPDSFFSDFLTANHILHQKQAVDGYGHVSVRSPQDATRFFLSASRAPALVNSRSEIVEYHVEDASSTDPDAPKPFIERFIHSEIYKRFPDVHCIVHGHAEDMIIFSVTDVPLKPVFHAAGVIGPSVPVFDPASSYSSSASHDLLISSTSLGASLASSFAPSSLLGKTGSVLKSFLPTGSDGSSSTAFPPHGLVLMRGHGFTAVGRSLREAVYRAVMAVQNARVQRAAMAMQGAWNANAVAERVTRVGKEGYESGGSGTKLGEIKYLSDREAGDAWESLGKTVDRLWELWTEEVRKDGLYSNEYLD